MTHQIVIATVEMSGFVKTGKMVWRDMNWFPEFAAAPEAKACMWLRAGSTDDALKAETFATKEDGQANSEAPERARRSFVFTIHPSEKDPLGIARKLALQLYTVA